MKPCQLCGANSWGPVPEAVDVAFGTQREAFLVGKDLTGYRRCDGCGSFASLVQMALDEPSRRDPVEESLGILTPGPANPMTAAFAAMKGMLPQPETRTERLVKAALAPYLSGDLEIDPEPEDALAIVRFIREVERLLDDPAAAPDDPGPVVEGSFVWHAHEWNFKDRDELLQWMIAGLSVAKEHLRSQQMRCVFDINRVAGALLHWMEDGGATE